MTPYPYLKDNVDALAAAKQPIYHWLSQSPWDVEALQQNIFQNKWGLIDWRMESGQGLFESLPPMPLYRDWAPVEKAETSATIVVGCNLGYGINHLLTNTPNSHKVVVIEPRPEMLLACLGQTDFRPFLDIKKLHFAPPSQDYLATLVQNLDMQFVHGKIYVRFDQASQQLGPEYALWARRLRDRMENFSVELTTLRYRQDVMVGNELANFSRAMEDGSLLGLKDSAAGLSAVILGAGPSLTEMAPRLKDNPGYALYATSLQAMPALQRLGLKPHFCMAIDFNKAMLKVYDQLDPEFAKDVPFIYSTKVQPELVRRYPGRTIPLWTLGGLATFVMQNSDLVLDAGGNVTLTLARLLKWCGVSNITLAGQDFAWKPDSQSHAPGHHVSDKPFVFKQGTHERRTNLHGEEIITSRQFMASVRELENDLKKDPFPVHNLYGGGIVIKGAKNVDLDQARKSGLLASSPGSVQGFLARLEHAREFNKSFAFQPKSHVWTTDLKRAEKRLAKLLRKPEANRNEIHTLLEHVLVYIKQDPLYLPYLFNETVNLSGLAKAKFHYEGGDLSTFRAIQKDVLKKVREIDRTLSAAVQGTQAA